MLTSKRLILNKKEKSLFYGDHKRQIPFSPSPQNIVTKFSIVTCSVFAVYTASTRRFPIAMIIIIITIDIISIIIIVHESDPTFLSAN